MSYFIGQISKMKVYIVAVLLSTFVCSFASEESISSYFCTKSAYRFVANEDVTDVSQEELESAEKIWMFLRHGTRNPNAGDIEKQTTRLPEIQNIVINRNADESGVLTSDEVALFEAWSPYVTNVEDIELLTPEGAREHFELAQRMQTRYPHLFPSVFDNDTYLIKFTDSQRTRESTRHFALGLFGAGNIDDVYFPEPTLEDEYILDFFEVCRKWKDEIEDSDDALEQSELFEKTKFYKAAISRVNEALGLTDELVKKDIKMMFKACAFETSWFRNASSPWCIPFDVETVKPLAYAEDLEYFYVDGYGYSLNSEQACLTFNDMINFFEEESDRKTALYFTHSGAVIKFITHLGLFNDNKMLVSSEYEQNQDVLWKISRVGNFASNVAVILHNIDGAKKISVRQDEYIMRLPACPDSDLCDLEVVKEYYENSINNCNFDEICENN